MHLLSIEAGGQFAFELGGRGKSALIQEVLGRAFARYDCEYTIALHFLAISKYAFLKEAVDFKVRTTLLSERRTRFVCTNGLHD